MQFHHNKREGHGLGHQIVRTDPRVSLGSRSSGCGRTAAPRTCAASRPLPAQALQRAGVKPAAELPWCCGWGWGLGLWWRPWRLYSNLHIAAACLSIANLQGRISHAGLLLTRVGGIGVGTSHCWAVQRPVSKGSGLVLYLQLGHCPSADDNIADYVPKGAGGGPWPKAVSTGGRT